MPLNVGAANEARRGALRQEAAADHLYQQKLIEQDYQWSDLVERLTDAQERLKIASTIEQTQKQKLDHEKQLLRQGRSTTFQVLQFEQDYSSAELARAQAGYQILDLQSQMKPYFESDSDLRSSRTHVSFLK
jgi:outer membrane protein TolC